MPDKKVPPSASDAGALLTLVEHDYFRLKLDEEVRARTKAELSEWWKKLAAVAGVVVVVATAIGIKEFYSIKRFREDAEKNNQREIDDFKAHAQEERNAYKELNDADRKSINEKSAEIDAKARDLAGLLKSAGVEVARVQATAEALRQGGSVNDARVSNLLTAASKQLLDSAEASGALRSNIDKKENELNDLRESVRAEVGNSKKLREALADIESRRDIAFNQKVGSIEDISRDVLEVKEKFYGGGTYVLKEKRLNKIKVVLGDETHHLFVQVEKVSSGKLHDVKVLDERYKPVERFAEIAEQDSMTFDAYEYKFTLTLRFIIENTLRSDHAGIDRT